MKGKRSGTSVGDYDLFELLGQGSYAEVYLGQKRGQEECVAVKVLHDPLPYEEEAARAVLRREADVIKQLEHLHIVRLLDFDIDGTTPYIVMSYASNQSLRHRYPHGTYLPLDTILIYVKQIAEALMYAHSKNIIHRDLKPENILLGEDDAILIADFGIAKIVQTARSVLTTHGLAGTRVYMAPEQYQKKVSFESDQYALAVMVYEWVCGKPPFEGEDHELLHQHLHEFPQPLRMEKKDIPEEFEKAVFRALRKHPKARFESIQAFADALDQALNRPETEEEDLSALDQEKPPSPQERSTSLFSRRRLLGCLIGSGIGMTGIALGIRGVTWSMSRKPAALLSIYHLTGNSIGPMAWSPDGELLAYILSSGGRSSSSSTSIFAPSSGKMIIEQFTGQLAQVTAFAWSRSSKLFACVGQGTSLEYQSNTVEIWNVLTQESISLFHMKTSNLFDLAWSQDDKYLVSSEDSGRVRIWSASSGKDVSIYQGSKDETRGVTWSPDGKRIAFLEGERTVKIWDAPFDKGVLTYSEPSHTIITVAWAPDSTRLATLRDDGTIRIWNVSTGSDTFLYRKQVSRALNVFNGEKKTFAWSPDNRYIASIEDDDMVRIWDTNNGKQVFVYNGHADSYWDHLFPDLSDNIILDWSAKGKLIASAARNVPAIHIWQVP